jgi:hypothetical protein
MRVLGLDPLSIALVTPEQAGELEDKTICFINTRSK